MTKQTKPRARSTQSTLWLVVLLLLLAFYFFYTRQAPPPATAPPGATPTVTMTAGDAAPATEAQPASAAVAPAAGTDAALADGSSAAVTAQPQAAPRGARPTATRAPPALIDGLPTMAAAELPPAALDTLALIESDGPFPFSRDGVVFQNRERLLPRQSEGYYHEYTVITPGSSDRGARRIITGETGERYYTDDHYASFFVIVELP